MMDYLSSLYILEDIIETFPIKDMEILFDIIEKNLKSQLNKSVRIIKKIFNLNLNLNLLSINNILYLILI